MTILVRGWEGSSAQPVPCRYFLTLRCDGIESVTREADDRQGIIICDLPGKGASTENVLT